MKIAAEAIYLTDNGAAYCGDHLGATAKASGRDLSGQPIHRVSPEDAKEMLAMIGRPIRCEQPRCGRTASLLVSA